jgi:hypothetical protein
LPYSGQDGPRFGPPQPQVPPHTFAAASLGPPVAS